MLRERTLSLILTVWPFRKQANPRRLYEPYHPCHGKPGTGKGVRRLRRHGRSGALPALPRRTMQRRLPGRNRSGPIHPLVAFLEPLGSGRDHPGKQSAGSELFPHLSGQRTVRRRLCPVAAGHACQNRETPAFHHRRGTTAGHAYSRGRRTQRQNSRLYRRRARFAGLCGRTGPKRLQSHRIRGNGATRWHALVRHPALQASAGNRRFRPVPHRRTGNRVFLRYPPDCPRSRQPA